MMYTTNDFTIFWNENKRVLGARQKKTYILIYQGIIFLLM